MADSILKHKGCGGAVFVDVSSMIRFTTPAMAFTPTGISLPVLEIQSKGTDVSPAYYCSKCRADIPKETLKKEIEVECLVCSGRKSVGVSYCSHQISAICEECMGIVTGKITPQTDKQRRIAQYLQITEEVSFVKFLDILKIVRI